VKLFKLFFVLGVIVVFFIGCGLLNSEDECKDVCDGDMIFSTKDISIGGYRYDQGDSHALVGECGFDYVGGRTGGYGNTLEIKSVECGIHLEWAWYRLLGFHFSKNFKGKIKPSGLRVGDPITKYKTAYPDWGAIRDSTIFWKEISYPTYHHIFDEVYILAYANPNGTIDSLEVTGRWDPEIWDHD